MQQNLFEQKKRASKPKPKATKELKEWLRSQSRNFTVGKPPMFSPLQRVCRKASRATIFQLRRWAKAWPKKARELMKAHKAFVSLNGDQAKSPFLEPILALLGGTEFIKAEVASRASRTPNHFDFALYELETSIAVRRA